ncbi:MAG: DNRLRE domain-containing protein, partial [Pirellulales bacterium]|nr:DNRLRE domain-containing protein [Pirellulales bacterium]
MNRKHKGCRRSASQRRSRLSFESLERRELLAVTTFQFGASGYEGQQDTVIFSLQPDSNFGTEGHVSADQQDFNAVRQGLIKFDDIFGDQPGQIPYGATINSANLELYVQDSSNAAMQMSLYRMLTDWDESTATWNFFGGTTGGIGGVQASEGEATGLPPEAVLLDSKTTPNSSTAGKFDVSSSVEYWAAGAQNFGWLVESAATNGWDFRTNNSNQSDRPKLIIEWDMPASTADFQILNVDVSQAEGNSGTRVAKVDVARLGNISAPATINYTVTAGGSNPADAGDFVAVSTPTALNFAANDAFETIEVTINGDTELEGLETILVTLSGGDIVTGRDIATVSIADDDILINEVLANVSNASNEENREYIELVGTPGADLTGYYFVVFEGEEEENSGTGSGRADFVIDLSPYTFGTNGLLVFVPGDSGVSGYTWEYAPIADTASNIVELNALMAAGGKLEDSSQTYALIYSPTTAIAQDTDYDTVGFFEDTIAEALGTGVGLLDQLPADAQWIDSVGTVEGGSGDRDRVATPPSLGHPGIHVHQPTSVLAPVSTAVAADAISRRFGETLPNSIGVWFNGDISNGTPTGTTIPY